MTEGPGRFVADGIVTPALVLDLPALERNVAGMAELARWAGTALRPHAKTHKTPEIAARQIAAGAVGLSVATLGEAETFVAAGVDDVFVAYPLWPAGDLRTRLATLAARARVAIGCDSESSVRALGTLSTPSSSLHVLIEVDCGLGRTGVAPGEAGSLAAVAADVGLAVDGVFTFPGHSYRPGGAAQAAADERHALAEAAASLRSAGLACPVRSGGSTPSARSSTGPTVNELRPGVYVFNDAQQIALGTCEVDDVALACVATVVSTAVPGHVVLDAGSKVLGADRPEWLEDGGLVLGLPGARVRGLWEHHAVVDVSALTPAERPRIGSRLAVVPNHVCSAVNLVPFLYVASKGRLVGRFEVAARGANR